ncbi:MAG TPA: MFS transporter [Allosphingosinicella sp.]|nr:MFS transporter [Allosphingosinicella sp.]
MTAISLEQAGGDRPGAAPRPAAYAWVVFALTFGLLISDYMARQVLNAVFPLLKAEWALSDTQLGALSGVVALMVGLLTFPLSLLADRWGWIRSITLMAVLWSIATLVCGMAKSYEAMFAGRLLVGIGEAAYGSVGIAVVVSVFPKSMRATLAAAFMAGGLVGQVLGVGLGGYIADIYGWRTAFVAIAIGGLALALVYPLVVQQRRTNALAERLGNAPGRSEGARPSLKLLFARRALICAYVGSGLQLYVGGALPAWLPTYFHDYYGLSVSAAAVRAAMFLLAGGAGMVLCAMLSDRLSRRRPSAKYTLAFTCSLLCATALLIAFALPPGPLQLAALAVGMFFAAATSGPAGAMVANLTPLRIHGSAFATLTVANNALGLAAGPILTGRLADSWGLAGALAVLPVPCVAAAIIFWIGRRSYPADLAASAAQG